MMEQISLQPRRGHGAARSSLHRLPPQTKRRTHKFPRPRKDRRSERYANLQTPGNIPLLFDLVKPKLPQLTHALYKVLRDTLVV